MDWLNARQQKEGNFYVVRLTLTPCISFLASFIVAQMSRACRLFILSQQSQKKKIELRKMHDKERY